MDSLKLTTLAQCYLSLVVVLAREDAEVNLHAPPRLNTSGCVYGRNVILKNCIIVMKKTSGPQDAPGHLKCPHPHSHWQYFNHSD